MGARADRLNRVLLALLGLLLLAAGAAVLLAGSGLLGDDVSRRRLVHPQVSDFVARHDQWLWPVVAVLALLLSLLALRWLLLQLQTDRIDAVDLTQFRRSGETHVDAAAVTSALVEAVEQCPGVDSGTARLVRVRGRAQLLLHVRLADRADLAATREQLAHGPIRELAQALGEDSPEVVVELEPSTKGSARAVI
jgi:hypothetical protein